MLERRGSRGDAKGGAGCKVAPPGIHPVPDGVEVEERRELVGGEGRKEKEQQAGMCRVGGV